MHFFTSHLPRWLRTHRFREPTFRPSGATKHWKNTVFRDFSTCSRILIFFLLTLSLLWSSFFFPSLLWLFPPLLLHLSILILSEIWLLNFFPTWLNAHKLSKTHQPFVGPLVAPNDLSKISSSGAESTGRRRWFHFGFRLGEGQVAPVKARFVAGMPGGWMGGYDKMGWDGIMDYATQNISQLWDCVVWLSNNSCNQGCDYSCGDNGSNRYPIVIFFSQELKIQLRSTTWVTSLAFREMGRGNCWWSANVTKLRNLKLHLRIQTDTTDKCTSRVFVDWLWFVSVFVQGNMLDLYNLDGHRPFCYQMPGAGTWRRLAEDCSFACHEESRCWHRMSWHRVGKHRFPEELKTQFRVFLCGEISTLWWVIHNPFQEAINMHIKCRYVSG